MSYRVRWASEDDIPLYFEMLRSLVEAHKNMMKFLTSSHEQLKEALNRGDFHLAVLVDDTPNVIHGCISLNLFVSVEWGRGFYIDDFFINPDRRRQGLGRAMIEMVCRLAHKCNVDYLTLIYQDGLSAAKLYQNLGFINKTQQLGVKVCERFEQSYTPKAHSVEGIKIEEISSTESLEGWIASIKNIQLQDKSTINDLIKHCRVIGIESLDVPYRRVLIIVQRCFTSWTSSIMAYIHEIAGDISLITKDSLKAVFSGLISEPYIWIELSNDLVNKYGVYLQEELLISDISESQRWNICIIYSDGMKRLLESTEENHFLNLDHINLQMSSLGI